MNVSGLRWFSPKHNHKINANALYETWAYFLDSVFDTQEFNINLTKLD